jgi:hypothetical protein
LGETEQPWPAFERGAALRPEELLDILNAGRELVGPDVKLVEAWRVLAQTSYATVASTGRPKTSTPKVAIAPAGRRLLRIQTDTEIASIRLRTDITVRKMPLNRQTLTAIV